MTESVPVAQRGLRVRDLIVQHGRVQALSRVTVDVGEREIVTIVGANGAGKTSLLNALAGIAPARSGSATWNGASLLGLPAHRIVGMGIGYVPEGREIFGDLSVLDNLLLGAYSSAASVGGVNDGHTSSGDASPRFSLRALLRLVQPASSFARAPRVQSGLDRVFGLFPRLAERRGQVAGSLSGGEQQMLALGRALMSWPSLLLLDEPSIGLAPTLVREVLRLLPTLREDGLTILLVEQDAVAALKIADRGYVLERGGVVLEGPSSELLNTDRIRRAYLGRAADRPWRRGV